MEQQPNDQSKQHAALLEEALFEVKRVIVGQDRMIERSMICLLARGHCLLIGVGPRGHVIGDKLGVIGLAA